jgi:hypothetical protein
MLTLSVLAVFALVVVPALAWALRVTLKVFGWTLRMALGVLFLPLWIAIALIGGVAVAFQALLPIALLLFVASLFVSED